MSFLDKEQRGTVYGGLFFIAFISFITFVVAFL